MNSQLLELGWNDDFQREFDIINQGFWTPARIVRENRGQYIVTNSAFEAQAQLSGAYRMQSLDSHHIPTVGDWVCVEDQPSKDVRIIKALIPRKTCIERQVAGNESKNQLIAANIDTLFLVNGLDGDLNLNRIQRYLTLSGNSGAQPVIILNKSDLCENVPKVIGEVESIAPNVPIHALSAISENAPECIRPYVQPGKTIALLGSSGVGKSTLINTLLGEAKLRTQSTRASDNRGRHTTTWRELIQLPGGGNLIDLPGMRELQLTGDDEGLRRTFEELELLARRCRFRDCRHEGEPGCAIEAAIEEGTLDPSRYTQFVKLKQETKVAQARSAERIRQVRNPKQERRDKERYFKEVHIKFRKNKKAHEKWKRRNDLL